MKEDSQWTTRSTDFLVTLSLSSSFTTHEVQIHASGKPKKIMLCNLRVTRKCQYYKYWK